MQKWWSMLFLLVPVFGVAFFAIAMTSRHDSWWLPEQASSYSADIDQLFNVILGITGVTFVATQAALAWFLFRYRGQPGRKGTYIHSHHRTELIWTLVPALILIYVAYAQMGTWADVKMNPKLRDQKPLAQIVARQFEWRFRYAGLDGAPGVAGVDDDGNKKIDDWDEWGYPGSDDVESVNELHVPAGEDIVLHLRSLDVLHSFFVPEFRLKQDAVPGLTIPIWFQVKADQLARGAPRQYDLMCAELCGWGHYKMLGKVTVDTAQGFRQWLQEALEKHRDSGALPSPGG